MSTHTDTTPVSPRTRAREAHDRTRDALSFQRFLDTKPNIEAFASVQDGIVRIKPEVACFVREWMMIQLSDGVMELHVAGKYEYQNDECIRYPIPMTRTKRLVVIHGSEAPRLLRIDRILEYALVNPAKCKVCIIDLNS